MTTKFDSVIVPRGILERIHALVRQSRPTWQDSPEKRACRIMLELELIALVKDTTYRYGISISRLSLSAGLGQGVLRARFIRHKENSDDVKNIRIHVCKNGHDLTLPGSRRDYQCRRCETQYKKSWQERNPDEVQKHARMQTERMRRQYLESLESADRTGYMWTGPELELLTRRDLTTQVLAQMTHRTTFAVKRQRSLLNRDPRRQVLAGIVRSEL